MKELHISLDEEDYEKLKRFLPERGQISILIRSILRQYIKRIEEVNYTQKNTIEDAIVSKTFENSTKKLF